MAGCVLSLAEKTEMRLADLFGAFPLNGLNQGSGVVGLQILGATNASIA
jgi:hypothetical protein